MQQNSNGNGFIRSNLNVFVTIVVVVAGVLLAWQRQVSTTEAMEQRIRAIAEEGSHPSRENSTRLTRLETKFESIESKLDETNKMLYMLLDLQKTKMGYDSGGTK